MWLFYNSFIKETDTKEKKAEALSRRKQTDKKRFARVWKTNDKRCSNEALSQAMKKKEEKTRGKKKVFSYAGNW